MKALAAEAETRVAHMLASNGEATNISRIVTKTTFEADSVHFACFVANVFLVAVVLVESLIALWANSQIARLRCAGIAHTLKKFS